MQLSKYYTPDISEFYVGFEFEYFNKSGKLISNHPDNKEQWDKEICDFDWIENIIYDWEEEPENVRNYRVKYLDSKDLEELGWIIDFISDDIIHCRLIENAYYFLVLGLESKVIISYKDEVLFNGKIKNKSELKKLMQQLGIL